MYSYVFLCISICNDMDDQQLQRSVHHGIFVTYIQLHIQVLAGMYIKVRDYSVDCVKSMVRGAQLNYFQHSDEVLYHLKGICLGHIPLHKTLYMVQVPPINRFLKFPLKTRHVHLGLRVRFISSTNQQDTFGMIHDDYDAEGGAVLSRFFQSSWRVRQAGAGGLKGSRVSYHRVSKQVSLILVKLESRRVLQKPSRVIPG